MDLLVDEELENSERWLIFLYLRGRRREESRRESVSGWGQSLDSGRDVMSGNHDHPILYILNRKQKKACSVIC
jgi:hypothetical protein